MNTTDQATTALNGCVSCNLIFATPTEVIGHVLTAHTARRAGSTMDSQDSKSLADHARAAGRPDLADEFNTADAVDAALDAWAAEQYPDDPSPQEQAYLDWCASEAGRGELAGAPDTIGCYECGGFDGVTAPERTVVKLGRVLEPHRDPTQSYVLDCGHVAI
jgi:hypothetical protein